MADDTIKRRLAAIVAADMAGYSRLMQIDEAGTVARQKACLDEVVLPRIREFQGRLVKTTGDGLLAEFPSAVDAVLCSVAVQRDMAAREGDIAEDRRIAYRIGINVGEIIYDGDDIFGDGVNVAARLEALAEPGGIRISDTVFNTVKGKLDLGFADLGAQKVKNIADPVPTYQVLLDPADVGKLIDAAPKRRPQSLALVLWVAAVGILLATGYLFYNRLAPPPAPSAIRLLILPYQPDTDDAAIYAEAVSENLWLTMARLRDLTIVRRASALTFEGVDPTAEQIAELGAVTHVLDGSTSAAGSEITVTSRLRRVADGAVVWQQQTAAPVPDLFAGLARQKTAITSALKLPLNATERDILEQTFTADPQAFLHYAQARTLFQTSHWNNFRKAMELFEKATEIDPGFTSAYLGYAEINFEVWRRGWSNVRNTRQARIAAENTAGAILDADPTNPEALAIKVLIRINMRQFDEALHLAQGAFFKNTEAHQLRYALGWALLANAEYEKARAEFRSFTDIAPRLTTPDTFYLVSAYLALDDTDQALALLATLKDDPSAAWGAAWAYAQAYARTGNLDAASQNMDIVRQGWPAANIMWMKPWVDIYKDPAVFETYSAAMQAAGMPLWPFDFDKTHAADRLDHDALTALYGPGFRSVEAVNELGGVHDATVRPDGTIEFRSDFLSSRYRGTWRIVDDTVCLTFPDLYKGREACELLFVDREGSTPDTPRYILLNSFGLRKFGIARLGE